MNSLVLMSVSIIKHGTQGCLCPYNKYIALIKQYENASQMKWIVRFEPLDWNNVKSFPYAMGKKQEEYIIYFR